MKLIQIFIGFLFLSACFNTSQTIDIASSVKNASVHILVTDEYLIPEQGTFTWGPQYYKIKRGETMDFAALDRRLKKSIGAEMELKGYSLAEPDAEADLMVGYAVAHNSSIDGRDFNASYGNTFRFSFPVIPDSQRESYKMGTLIIDVLDMKQKKLLWRGALLADVDRNILLEEKDQYATPVVKALLDSFPRPKL